MTRPPGAGLPGAGPPLTRPPRTVPGFLAWRAAQEPDRVAIEVAGGSAGPPSLTHPARLTLREWDRGASAVAAGLRQRGIRPGDRVGLRFGPAGWIDFAVAYCGVQRAGAVAVPLSQRLAAGQLGYALAQCAAAGVVHGAGPAPAGVPAGVWTATVPSLTEAGPVGEPVAVRPGDLAQILYTSGTTGRPKGVAATHANLSLGAPTHPRRLRLAHSARFTHAFPIGTNAAQTMLFNALYTRPGAVLLAQLTPARFARLVARPEVGTVFLVPSMAVELLDSGVLAGPDLSHVHLVGSTAAPLPGAVAAKLAAVFPNATVVNYYTSTEAAPAHTSMIFDPGRPDALGRAADGRLMVADADGNPLPPGATGEVWLHSPYPRSYYRDEAATRTTFRGEWVRMGDIGRLDSDGYLYLTDRHDDLVKSGGFRVSTLEVEAALYQHPQVADAAVFGVPDDARGTALVAVVVPRSQVPPGEPAPAAVRRFLSTRLADYQLPVRVLLRDRLPRNEGGKVLKRALAAELRDAERRTAERRTAERRTAERREELL